MNKAIAEFIGTFALVLVGCGAAVIASAARHRSVPPLGIAWRHAQAVANFRLNIVRGDSA